VQKLIFVSPSSEREKKTRAGAAEPGLSAHPRGACPALPWGRLADLPLRPLLADGSPGQAAQWRVKGCCSDVQSFKLKKRSVALCIYVEDGTAPKRVCLLAEPLVLDVLAWPGSVKELASLKKDDRNAFSAVLDRGASALRRLEGVLTIGKHNL
jgi:hypothetical protein